MSQTLKASADERFVIHGVDWATYEKFLDAVGERHVFLTYDGDSLEFRSPVLQREVFSIWLTLLIRLLAEHINLPIRCIGSATLKNAAVRRGLEPHSAFYVQSVEAILGRMDLDLRRDPPPDLVVEVDLSDSRLDRQRIFGRLGVPELWKFNGETLRVYCLGLRNVYQLQERSPTFPGLNLIAVPALFSEFNGRDDTANLRALRRWIRKHVVARKRTTVGR